MATLLLVSITLSEYVTLPTYQILLRYVTTFVRPM